MTAGVPTSKNKPGNHATRAMVAAMTHITKHHIRRGNNKALCSRRSNFRGSRIIAAVMLVNKTWKQGLIRSSLVVAAADALMRCVMIVYDSHTEYLKQKSKTQCCDHYQSSSGNNDSKDEVVAMARHASAEACQSST